MAAHAVALLLLRFLNDQVDVPGLRAGLAALTWGIAAWGSQEDRDLTGEVELALAEYEAGHMDLAELRQELERLCPRTIAVDKLTIHAVPPVTTGASQRLFPHRGLSPWAGTQPSAGFSSPVARAR